MGANIPPNFLVEAKAFLPVSQYPSTSALEARSVRHSTRGAWFLNINNKLGCSGISKLHCASHRRRRLIVAGSRASACSLSRSRFTIVAPVQPLPPAAQRIQSLNQTTICHSVLSPIYEVPQLSGIVSPNRVLNNKVAVPSLISPNTVNRHCTTSHQIRPRVCAAVSAHGEDIGNIAPKSRLKATLQDILYTA